METFAEVLNKNLNKRSDPTLEQFQSTIDGLHRLLTELERPQNRDLMRFVIAWQKLEKELDKLQCQIQERIANAPIDRVNEFLQKLKRTN